MLLYEPAETAFDLRWRMFGVPVRVHPFFWLLSAMLGWVYMDDPDRGFPYLLAWVACVFVSILLHELGHVFVGRMFGSHGHIVLYTFGGLAIGSSNLGKRWQRVSVLLGGPLPQLALAAIIWFSEPHAIPSLHRTTTPETARLLVEVLKMLFYINFYWAILNLLPIWPLDGGQITREVCEGGFGRAGLSFALGVSLVLSGILALHFFVYASKGNKLIPFIPGGGFYSALFFLFLAVGSFQAMQVERERHRRDDDWPWNR